MDQETKLTGTFQTRSVPNKVFYLDIKGLACCVMLLTLYMEDVQFDSWLSHGLAWQRGLRYFVVFFTPSRQAQD